MKYIWLNIYMISSHEYDCGGIKGWNIFNRNKAVNKKHIIMR
jgi:hypothetical protein